MKGIRTYIGYYKQSRSDCYQRRIERRTRWFAYRRIEVTQDGSRHIYTARPTAYLSGAWRSWSEPCCYIKSRGNNGTNTRNN